MERLDQTYLKNLVLKARQGSSNSFAELFVSVYPRHLLYLSHLVTEPKDQEQILTQIWIRIREQLETLGNPELFMPWSIRICRRCLMEKEHRYSALQAEQDEGAVLMQMLPVSESEIMIMHYGQGLSFREIGNILNLGTDAVRRVLKNGSRRLKSADPDWKEKQPKAEKNRSVRIGDISAPQILEQVFEYTGNKPNTIPLEALSAYSVYRKERFSLQRGILAGAMILFLLLPLLFVLPEYEVYGIEKGLRGLPVVTIDVKTVLPVNKVLVKMKNHSLPVYEANARQYTIEPIRNGTMKIEVELINRQKKSVEYEVTDVDREGPKLVDSRITEGQVVLMLQDAGIGIHYREIYALSESGQTIRPEATDPETGSVTFPYPQEAWDVFIPDYLGNTLHLSFTFE